jgi:hypothetical protein
MGFQQPVLQDGMPIAMERNGLHLRHFSLHCLGGLLQLFVPIWHFLLSRSQSKASSFDQTSSIALMTVLKAFLQRV